MNFIIVAVPRLHRAVSLAAGLYFALIAARIAHAQPPTASCASWQDCQSRAVEAEQARDFERFHDLAWRAVQLSPKNNVTLLFMLARAQVLSGRPHDSLVMLERLA